MIVKEPVFGLVDVTRTRQEPVYGLVDVTRTRQEPVFGLVDVTRTRQKEIRTPVTKTRKVERTRRVPIAKDGSKIRTRYHHGVIAQQVKQVIDETGVDFGGYQDSTIKGGLDNRSMGYGEFIAPLIKSVQELYSLVKELSGKI